MADQAISVKAIQQAQAREREAKVLSLRLAGVTFEAIGRQLGITESGAHRAYTRAIARLPGMEHREELRALEAARLDAMQSRIWQRVLAGDLEAIDAVLRLMKRRAALLGLDAPVQINLTILLKLIGELKALPPDDLLDVLGYSDDERLSLPDPEGP